MPDYYVVNAVASPNTGNNRNTWLASTTYAAGDRVVGVAVADYWVFECTAGGTSGSTEPAWTKTDGATQPTDGGVTWVARLPDTWADASISITRASTSVAAGDRVFVASDFAFSQGSNVNWNSNATPGNPALYFSADKTSGQPPTLQAGASLVTTSTNNITVGNNCYAWGFTFKPGNSAAVNADLVISGTNFSGNATEVENCTFDIANGSSSAVQIANATDNNHSHVTLRDCTVRFRSTGNAFEVYSSVSMRDVNLDAAGSLVTTLLKAAASRFTPLIEAQGCDFSRMSASGTIVSFGVSGGLATLRNCKFPASFTGAAASSVKRGNRASFYECEFGTVRQMLWIVDPAGSIKEETTVLRTGGASDGVDAISWKMETTAGASYVQPLYTDYIAVPVYSTGSKTFTVEIVHDSAAGGELTDNEIWLEVEYQGTASSRLGALADDRGSYKVEDAIDQTTSSATWTGTSGFTNTPIKQKLSVTVTVNEEGPVYVRVGMNVDTKVVYVCPKVDVT